MSTFTLTGAAEIDPARLHSAFTSAFADYLIGPFQVPLSLWPGFLARQGVDLGLSRVALDAGAPIAFCLTAPRPECGSWRLGTMGALPAARGTGAAAALLDDFMARARAAGAGWVELECFAQNPRALRLYQARGFQPVDALYGWQSTAPAAQSAVRATGAPSAVSLPDAFDWLDACRAQGCELPLQVTPRSLRASTVPLEATRHGSAQVVFSDAADAGIHVHSLVDRDATQQAACELVGALIARHPGRSIRVPQLQRQCVGGDALERLGFERLPLHQVWMRKPS